MRAAFSAVDLQREIADTDLRLPASRVRYAALTRPHSARQTLRHAGQPPPVPDFPPNSSSPLASGRQYLAQLRERQSRIIAGLGGSSPLTSSDPRHIAAGLASSQRCRELPQGIAENLTRRLEIMAVRQRFPVPPEWRGVIYDLLAMEFSANLAAYGGTPARLVAATVYRGDVSGLSLAPEFSRFRPTPGIFAYVVRSSPRDPAAALHRAAQEIDRLETDPRFAGFRDSPGVFHHAVWGQAAMSTTLQNCRELQQMSRNFVALGGVIGAGSTGTANSADFLNYISGAVGTRALTNAGAAQNPVACGAVIDNTGNMNSGTIRLTPTPDVVAVPAGAQTQAAGFHVAAAAANKAAWISDGVGNAWTLDFDVNGNLTVKVIAAAKALLLYQLKLGGFR